MQLVSEELHLLVLDGPLLFKLRFLFSKLLLQEMHFLVFFVLPAVNMVDVVESVHRS